MHLTLYLLNQEFTAAKPLSKHVRSLGCKASETQIQGTNNLVPHFGFHAKDFRLRDGGFEAATKGTHRFETHFRFQLHQNMGVGGAPRRGELHVEA